MSGILDSGSSAMGSFGGQTGAGGMGPATPASGFLGGLSGQGGMGQGQGMISSQNVGALIGQLLNDRTGGAFPAMQSLFGNGQGGGGPAVRVVGSWDQPQLHHGLIQNLISSYTGGLVGGHTGTGQ